MTHCCIRGCRKRAKLPRMRLGVPDGSALAAEMDAILKEGN